MKSLPGEKLALQQRYQQREQGKTRKKKKKSRIVRHHMTNRCHGGKNTDSNLLRMKESREKALHAYFKNLSWEEIGDVLYQVFGLRDPQKCYEVVRRISRLKGRVA